MLKKPPRSAIDKHTYSELAAFYEGDAGSRLRCVVTESDVEVELHHLDENPARSKVPYNLLPLKSSLNKNIDKRETRTLDDRITSSALQNKSALYYSRGKYAYGYGCSILGVTLAVNIPWSAHHTEGYFIDADTATFFAANALINLRPLNRLNYAAYVIQNYVEPIIDRHGAEVEDSTRARLAMEIGSYFRDAGDYKNARKLSAVAQRLLTGAVKSTKVKVLLARLWQHDGISAIIEGDFRVAEECFRRAESVMTRAYSIGHANQALYEVQILLRQSPPRFDRIRELTKQYSSHSDPHLLTKWTELELRLSEAQADYQLKDPRAKARAFTRVRGLLDRLRTERIIPTRAIFAPVLLAFADEYPSHKLEVRGLERTLPKGFVSGATRVQHALERLLEE